MANPKSIPLTVRGIEAAKPSADKVRELADAACPGLRVRIYPSGTKAFIARLRAADRRVRMLVLGNVGTLSLEAARQAVRVLQQERRQVGDPIAARRQQQLATLEEARQAENAASADRFTLRRLVDDFLDAGTGLRERTLADYRTLIDRNILPALGDVPARQVTSAQVRGAIKAVAARGKVTASRTLAALSSACEWAVGEELIDENPCRLVKRPSGGTARERTLSVAELRTLMRGLPAGMPADVAAAVEGMLRTGQRPGEVCGMDWSEIDGDLWTIPASRYKTGRAHRVPLAPQVLKLIGKPSVGPVWPRRRLDKVVAPLRGDTAVKAFAAALLTLEIAPATLHDLRRTFESRCVDTLKLDGDVVHHDCTGHVRPGVRGTYQRLDRLDAVREIHQKWSDWLDALKVDNVVALSGGAA